MQQGIKQMHQRIHDKMSSIEVHTVRTLEGLLAREKVRTGVTVPDAIRIVARRAKVAPGTIFNLINGRLKKLSVDVCGSIQRLAISELSQEIQRLEHERTVLIQSGVAHTSIDFCEVETYLAKAKALLTVPLAQPKGE